MPFLDRADAGRRLAGVLTGVRGADAIVLGLPRGGIPVGYEIAQALSRPLDVILVRKIGLPAQPELARRMAAASISVCTGEKWKPVPWPAVSAISLASITVSHSPPTCATTGSAP